MTENVITCEDCGRPYRADVLRSCPGCGNDSPLASNMSPLMYDTHESEPVDSGYLPPYERKQKFSEGKSFFAVLFNHRFEDFIFVRVASAFYLWVLVISAIALAFYEIGIVTNFFKGLNDAEPYGGGNSYIQENFWSFIGAFIALPLIYLFEVIILRLIIEAGVALIKIAENTSKED